MCYPIAVNFRQKPFLQADGVPACALPYAVCSVVDNVGISSIKVDRLSQERRTSLPQMPLSCDSPPPALKSLRHPCPISKVLQDKIFLSSSQMKIKIFQIAHLICS